MQTCLPPKDADVVYVIGQGWHAELGIPVSELDKNLIYFRDQFKGAHFLLFGYGKRTFVTAPVETLSEYIVGPFPGPAVVHVVGLGVAPDEAYPGLTTILALPEGGREALSEAIWNDLQKDHDGKPVFVAPSTEPDGLFYAAVSEYNIFHTCNTWTADRLHDAGLPVSGVHVTFEPQVISRVQDAADSQCPGLIR